MKIKDLLAMDECSDFSLLAGANGIERNISYVNVIDSPDSYLYFKGGELLLTNAYIMKDDISILKTIIEQSDKVGVAAIGIKVERFIQKLPEEIIQTANEIGFPIIAIPLPVAFSEIINLVLSQIVNEQFKQLEFSETVHKSFTNLVLQGGTIQQIVDTLSSILKMEVCYYDTYFEGGCYQSFVHDLPTAIDKAVLKKLLETNTYYAVELDKRTYGYLVIKNNHEGKKKTDELAVFRKIAAEHACTVLKLNLQKQISNRQIESKYRDEFVQGLLLNTFSSTEQIQAKAGLYGWRFNNGLTVVIINNPNPRQDFEKRLNEFSELFQFIKQKIRGAFPNSIYIKFGAQMIFLVDPGWLEMVVFKKQLQSQCQAIIDEVKTRYQAALLIGIGTHKMSLMEVYQSYAEAQKALDVGQDIGKPLADYDELGLFRLLIPVCDTEYAKEFYYTYLGKLIAYDEKNKTEYFMTLKALVDNDWNLKETAKQLYLHYNTVKNRYYKIAEILQFDLHNNEVKINLAICLKLNLLGK